MAFGAGRIDPLWTVEILAGMIGAALPTPGPARLVYEGGQGHD